MPVTPTPQRAPEPGLRERKKIRTREAIRKAAYGLMERQGYDATTVEQIAEAAEVSPSTVFRYFATKEDIILTDEYDPALEAALRARPAAEPPMVALRRAVMEAMVALYREFHVEVKIRMRLVRTVPALRARLNLGMDDSAKVLLKVLAERTGRSQDDFELRVVIGAVFGALAQAMFDWSDREEEDDIMELIDRALAVLERGLAL